MRNFLHQKAPWNDQDTDTLKQLIKTDPDKFRPAFMDKGQKTNG